MGNVAIATNVIPVASLKTKFETYGMRAPLTSGKKCAVVASKMKRAIQNGKKRNPIRLIALGFLSEYPRSKPDCAATRPTNAVKTKPPTSNVQNIRRP
jgi:hypothetical protein